MTFLPFLGVTIAKRDKGFTKRPTQVCHKVVLQSQP